MMRHTENDKHTEMEGREKESCIRVCIGERGGGEEREGERGERVKRERREREEREGEREGKRECMGVSVGVEELERMRKTV